MKTKKVKIHRQHIFSEELKKTVVTKIEQGEMRVLEACRIYDVKSPQTVYNWIYKYSRSLKKPTRIVLETNSVDKKLKLQGERIQELEAALGLKQLELELYRNIVDCASVEFDMDLKKNFGAKVSTSKSSREQTPRRK